MPPRSKIGDILFLSCLSFCSPLWNFHFANSFWTVSARVLISHMSDPSDKTFPWVPLFFTLWPWPWSLTCFFLKIDIGHYLYTISIRAFILHMNISCDEIFLLVSRYLSLWCWPSLELAIIGSLVFHKHIFFIWYFKNAGNI